MYHFKSIFVLQMKQSSLWEYLNMQLHLLGEVIMSISTPFSLYFTEFFTLSFQNCLLNHQKKFYNSWTCREFKRRCFKSALITVIRFLQIVVIYLKFYYPHWNLHHIIFGYCNPCLHRKMYSVHYLKFSNFPIVADI